MTKYLFLTGRIAEFNRIINIIKFSNEIKNAWNVDFEYTAIDAIKELMKYGYHTFDFNFGDYVRGEDSPMAGEHYLEWVKEIRMFADHNNIHFYQAHGHQFEVLRRSEEFNTMAIQRCIECSAAIGVEWLIFHPYPYKERNFEENLQNSIQKFDWIVPMATKLGVGVCFENLCIGDSFLKLEELLILTV